MVAITEEAAEKLFHDTGQLKQAYQMAFAGASGQAVLDDLARFCRANEPCWSEDQRHHARLEGRREVYLRIQNQLKLPVEELLQRRVGQDYTVVKLPAEDENE